jgi:23S rRNA pseudouridine1911/1915/1917 synthase
VSGREPLSIPGPLAGTRVDRVVALLTGLPRAQVRRLVEAGGVRLGGRPVTDGSRRVAAAELLEIDGPAPAGAEAGGTPAAAPEVGFVVVYEDERIVVVDKPAGLVVHPGAGHRDDTLVAGLLARFPDIAATIGPGGAPAARPGIVHRLDKDTSGLMVVARDREAMASLAAQLAGRTMGREYVAVVAGILANDEGVVDAPLRRSQRDRTRMAVAAAGQGRAARTHYSVRARFHQPLQATELLARLESGRTHQIRVHLAAIGHPVLGDPTYGGRRRELPLSRPFLHAWRLQLAHPSDGRLLTWTSPLPPELEAARASLE